MSPRPPIKSQQTRSAEPDPDTGPQDAPSDEYEPSVVDDMQADSVKVKKPAGSPQLWPYAQLPRRMRADFFQHLRSLGAMSNLTSLRGGASFGDMNAAADYMLFAADAEDAIRVVAHPSTADRLEDWLATSGDEDVINLLMWYLRTFQPGEAKGS